MGIKTTDSTATSEGTITGLYFHITEIAVQSKDGSIVRATVNYYTDDTATTPCYIFDVIGKLEHVYTLDLSASFNGGNIKKVAYDAIGARLKAAGLSPESDEYGSFVAY